MPRKLMFVVSWLLIDQTIFEFFISIIHTGLVKLFGLQGLPLQIHAVCHVSSSAFYL